MRLRINLASEDYRKTRLLKALLYVFSIFLVGGGILQVQSYISYWGEHRYIEESLQNVEDRRHALEEELRVSGMDTSEVGIMAFTKQIGTVNSLIAEKAFSWTLFLNELEFTVPRNISVMRLQPRSAEGTMTLLGKAISLKDLTRFIIGLEDSQAFEEVFLKDQATDKEGFIEFTVEFKYRSTRQGAQF